MPSKLDRKLVKDITGKPSKDFPDIKALDASKRDLTEVISLQYLPALTKLDLTRNSLREVKYAAECASLRWLNLSFNQLTSVKELSALAHLQVLNVSHNQISGKFRLEGCPSLCALIANDNAITSLKGLGEAKSLNTLVLKNNRISSLGKALAPCTALAKLSIAHNQLTDLADSLESCQQLAELRVSHNQLSGLPESLAQNPRLKIIEIGGNMIESLSSIKVVQKLVHLASCSLKGNPVAANTDYQQQIQALLPRLQILDGQKIARSSQGLQHSAPSPSHEQKLSSSQNKDAGGKPSDTKKVKRASTDVSLQVKPKKRRVDIAGHELERMDLPQNAEEIKPEAPEDYKDALPEQKKKKNKVKVVPGAAKTGDQAIRNIGKSEEPEAELVCKPKPWREKGEKDKASVSVKSQPKKGRSKDEKKMPYKAQMHGADVGAALQKGLLGTVLEPEAPLAAAWD